MKNKGFTLVELAIVLVIIGLLVGGVLQGQELIKQAQLRSVLSTLREFDVAINTFRAKYDNAMPGDITNACNFGLCVTPGTSVSNISDTTGVTGVTVAGNGNGDGLLVDGDDDYAQFTGEIANFWIHLSNAGLIKGSYSTDSQKVKIAYPSLPVGTAAAAFTDLTHKHRLVYVVGAPADMDSFFNAYLSGSPILTLTASDAYSIDSKIDDGAPATGIVNSVLSYSAGSFDISATTSSATCDDATTKTYNIATATSKCLLTVAGSN